MNTARQPSEFLVVGLVLVSSALDLQRFFFSFLLTATMAVMGSMVALLLCLGISVADARRMAGGSPLAQAERAVWSVSGLNCLRDV